MLCCSQNNPRVSRAQPTKVYSSLMLRVHRGHLGPGPPSLRLRWTEQPRSGYRWSLRQGKREHVACTLARATAQRSHIPFYSAPLTRRVLRARLRSASGRIQSCPVPRRTGDIGWATPVAATPCSQSLMPPWPGLRQCSLEPSAAVAACDCGALEMWLARR